MTDQQPNARQMLTDYDLPEDVIDGVLIVHAHQLAEHVRAESAKGRKSGLTRIYYRAAADMIDPQVHGDPLSLLRAIEEAPGYELVPGCPHCPDGHTPPDHGQPWGAYVRPERDGDGQPTTIHVARVAGAHVAESDAQWVRDRLNTPTV
ncbi:hypothetical protein [Streptomyces antimycoticus]|uniref:hypothetical protein n=1 Tax=Streptomyces antimycoticus TaxID=68175 RepID=UPI0033C35CB4